MRIAVGYRRDRWRLRESISRGDVSALAARVFEHPLWRDREATESRHYSCDTDR